MLADHHQAPHCNWAQTTPRVSLRVNWPPPISALFLHTPFPDLIYPDPSHHFCPSPHSPSRIWHAQPQVILGVHGLPQLICLRRKNQREDRRIKVSSLPCDYLQHAPSNHSPAAATSPFHFGVGRKHTEPASVYASWNLGNYLVSIRFNFLWA